MRLTHACLWVALELCCTVEGFWIFNGSHVVTHSGLNSTASTRICPTPRRNLNRSLSIWNLNTAVIGTWIQIHCSKYIWTRPHDIDALRGKIRGRDTRIKATSTFGKEKLLLFQAQTLPELDCPGPKTIYSFPPVTTLSLSTIVIDNPTLFSVSEDMFQSYPQTRIQQRR